MISRACHFVLRTSSNTPSAATASARAGISNMHEALNSMKPGEAMSSAVDNAATTSPLTRRLMKKTEESRIAANTEVTNRGPRMEGDKRLSTWVIKNV